MHGTKVHRVLPLHGMETQRIPTSVYAEMTPNPAVMKFVADRELVPLGHQLEFRSKSEAMLCSPLATELFNFPFVTGVFMSGGMVSVTKDDSLGWEMIVQQLRTYITEWLMEHPDAVEADKVEAAVQSMESGSLRVPPVQKMGGASGHSTQVRPTASASPMLPPALVHSAVSAATLPSSKSITLISTEPWYSPSAFVAFPASPGPSKAAVPLRTFVL